MTGTAERTTARSNDRRLLIAGMVAGPLFFASAILQGVLRDGFDLRRHALSQLSTGDLGWVQMLTFVATGLGVAALGLAVLHSGSRVAGRRTIASGLLVFGLGFVVAGLFPTDPAKGFPAGAPDGIGPMSWHGTVHIAAAVMAFFGLAVATGAATVHAIRAHAPLRAVLSGITTILLVLPSSPDYASIQLAVTGLIALTWTTALAARLYGSRSRIDAPRAPAAAVASA
ncbi:DUF998 domain-containing protein [Cellulomonas sp. Leaf334]|uniref:DUF998 domain-containing protein n=1 Tax=Cellulomonas sp. Leaf334 TaxID=1736339 RepID=UPI0009E728E9|nr:DUF998 domain-containing protein [Cellulomonas sp. Leaf334]